MKLKHIESTLGIINIRELKDLLGRDVVSIEVIPDQNIGEHKVKRIGLANTRLIKLKTVMTK